MIYVTYDKTSGLLTGAYIQELMPEHEDCYVEVTPEQHDNWVNLKFDLTTSQVVDYVRPVDLAALKAAKNEEINAARLAANFSTFTFNGKQIACDALSRSDIDGTNGTVTLLGALPPGWVGGWKAVDNTIVPIATLDDWKSFYSAMFSQGNANFNKSQQLKTQLGNATTPEQVAAIVW